MRWVIDGYNVIRRDPDLRAEEGRSLEAGRKALMKLLVVAAQRTADTFMVVFDGAPGQGAPSPSGRIEAIFSRPPSSADDVLKRLATQYREGAVVVTSDRAVQDAARRAHAVVVAADDFVRAIVMRQSDDAEGEDDEDDEDDSGGVSKRGNPRRLSRDERAAHRALRRLRGGVSG